MEWFNVLCGIPEECLLDVSIPKEKLINNIKSTLLRREMTYEAGNIHDIVYKAIFRDRSSQNYSDELHILEVVLFEPKYVKIIAKALQRTIPYSKIVIFTCGKKYLLFHARDDSSDISQYQFSDWAYEEELLIDSSLGTPRYAENKLMVDDQELWQELFSQFINLFDIATSSCFLCLRRLIDILKIREIQSGRSYVRSIVSQLVDEDGIEYFGDLPFVLSNYADQQYLRKNPHSHIEDGRFGIDRQFEPLTARDFTTQSETMALLHDAKHKVLFSAYERLEYDLYDKSYDDSIAFDYDNYADFD